MPTADNGTYPEHNADYRGMNLGPIGSRYVREHRDELASILFQRMISRRPVWVDSEKGQRVWIQMVGIDDEGECIAYDHEGNDRRAEEYLLASPGREESNG